MESIRDAAHRLVVGLRRRPRCDGELATSRGSLRPHGGGRRGFHRHGNRSPPVSRQAEGVEIDRSRRDGRSGTGPKIGRPDHSVGEGLSCFPRRHSGRLQELGQPDRLRATTAARRSSRHPAQLGLEGSRLGRWTRRWCAGSAQSSSERSFSSSAAAAVPCSPPSCSRRWSPDTTATPTVFTTGIGLVGIALAFGLTVLGGVYTFGHISGGHFNPAVTIGLATARRFPWTDAIAYFVAQITGAFFAAG